MHARRSLLLVLFALAVAIARPSRAEDTRELKARQLFAIGKYAEALEIFGNLYAETLHPTYLRNVGRCYQNLGEPDKAISSFSEYLRQARTIAPQQRAEVEGYIREMQELKRKRREEARPPRGAQPAAQASLEEPSPEAAATNEPSGTAPPIYTRWWFWTAAAVLVAGGVATALVLRSGGTPTADTTFGTMGANPKP